MKCLRMIVLPVVATGFLGCSTPKEKAYEAQEEVHKERLELVDEYKACIKDAGDDKAKAEACERYLKAADALK